MTLKMTLAYLVAGSISFAGEIDPSQQQWLPKYQKQENAPLPAEQLLNEDEEPQLEEDFVSLLNGTDLSDWEIRGGASTFEYKDGVVIGTCVPGEASAYLSTKKTDYADFIFTCEMKWEEDINSGVMFRAQSDEKRAVFGPQVEMEGIESTRGWSGGIYGQSCGGYWYPLWLTKHAEVRKALKKDGWNRVTVKAIGKTVKTWLNGVPATHWVGDGTYSQGYFGLQVHKAKGGKVMWRGLKVREVYGETARLKELDAYWAEVSRTVGEGDFEGYTATCHEDAVLVSGPRKSSYLLTKALERWEKEFRQTKAGQTKASVDFRFSKRVGDAATAHETGMFRYAGQTVGGKEKVVYIHLKALLVRKENGWKILMENQESQGTKEEWDGLE